MTSSRSISIITYTYHELEAPETVRDFLNGDLMLEYCAGNLMPFVMTPVDAERIEWFFEALDEDAATGGPPVEISDAQRQEVINWFKSLSTSEDILIAAVEG